MTAATAASGSQIAFRSRCGLAATNNENGSVSKTMPAAVVPSVVGVSDTHSLPATADGAERWTGGTRAATPGSRADSSEAYHYTVGPGPH